MKRIYVLGPNGMLGEMVRRYFGASEGFEVVAMDQRFDHANIIDSFRCFDSEPPAVFVNGIGAIPQKVSLTNDMVLPNILLPLELARTLAPKHCLIHPSTDSVYRGDRGSPYPAKLPPDASDAYGWSKLQAERALLARPNTLIIRTSIIGPAKVSTGGLLQWFLSQQPGAQLSGFTNHLWNGMTTLQWCVEVEQLLRAPIEPIGRLVQIGWRDGCSKHEMLQWFRDVFRPDITVTPVKHGRAIDRRLEPDIETPPLHTQLDQLRIHMEAT